MPEMNIKSLIFTENNSKSYNTRKQQRIIQHNNSHWSRWALNITYRHRDDRSQLNQCNSCRNTQQTCILCTWSHLAAKCEITYTDHNRQMLETETKKLFA